MKNPFTFYGNPRNHLTINPYITTLLFVFPLSIFFLFILPIVNANNSSGEKALLLGNFDIAFKEFKKSANAGDPKAQSNLGTMYRYGMGISKNYHEALKWILKSANQGEPQAQSNLGTMYTMGEGVAKNYSKALEWNLKAVKRNNPSVYFNLATMYVNGYGVEKNFKEGFRLSLKGAKLNDIGAQYLVAQLYSQGLGVERDLVQAVVWMNIAASKLKFSPVPPAEDIAKKAWNETFNLMSKLSEDEIKKATNIIQSMDQSTTFGSVDSGDSLFTDLLSTNNASQLTTKENEIGLFDKKDFSSEWINLENEQKEKYVVSAIKIYFENDLSMPNNKQYTEKEINDLIVTFKEQGIVKQIIDGITKGYLEKGGINKPVKKIVQEFIDNFFKKLNELIHKKEDDMGFFKNAMEQANRVNDYFCNAIRVSIFLGDKNSRDAALVAAKVAEKKQRKSMVDYIVGMAFDLRSIQTDGLEEKEAIETTTKNLLMLKTEIEKKNWGIKDIIEAKNSLAKTAPDLAKAIDPPVNPNIFFEKYPEVFEDER